MVHNPILKPLSPGQCKSVQEFAGLFCHYASCIDTTLFTATSSSATNITTATKKDLDFRINQLLDYAATHLDSKIRYIASDMHIWCHLDAYLSEPKARSKVGGFFYLRK